MTVTSGTRLGPYEIVAPLGAGGMGEVYRAKDSRLGREVAIKVLPAEVASDPERLRRFEQEARAASALNHPNILTVHDFELRDGKAYLVTELLEGSSLREQLSGNAATPLPKTLDWSVQIARGLAAAHEKGIVHRDLKPENLFVTRDGRVKILDFGLAKLTLPENGSVLAEAATLAGLTETGTVLGTVGYMAPEQVRGERVDARADLFSFGCVLYELITGARAFARPTPADTLSAILRDEPPALGAASAVPISPALAALVAHCLEKDPARRFHSAEDLAWTLESAREGSTPALAPAPPPARARSVSPIVAAAALAGAGLGALAVWWLTASRPSLPGLERLTFERGRISGARFAPDGKEVVLTASWGSEAPRLLLRRPDAPAPLPLETRDAKLLAVSRSGELALLLRPHASSPFGQSGTLARKSLGGGAPRELLDAVGAADWDPRSGDLALVVDQGDAQRIEFPPGTERYRTGGWISRLRFAPDGRSIGFLEHPSRGSLLGSVMLLDLAAGSTRELVRRAGNVDLLGLVWHPSGRELWFGDDLGRLLAVGIDGSSRLVAEYPLAVAVHDFAADGRLLLGQEDRRMGMLLDDPSGRTRELSWLRWSVLFDMNRAGDKVLFSEFTDRWTATGRAAIRGTDGGPVIELGEGMVSDLSPDERTAVVITQSEPFRLLLVPIGAGAVQELERGPIVAYDIAKITPDGRRIVFVGREANGGTRLFLQEIADGPPRQLSDEPIGFGLLAISPDGGRIATNGADGAARIFPIKGGPSRLVPGGISPGAMMSFSADGSSLLVRELGGVGIAIQRIDLASGVPTTVRALEPPDPIGIEWVGPVVTTPDERIWAYSYLRTLSTLYVANQLPER